MFSVPTLTKVLPVYVLAPARVTVPEPLWVKPAEPNRLAEMVAVPDVLLAA